MSDPLFNRIPQEKLSPDMQAMWHASREVAGEAEYLEVFANHPALLSWYNSSFYGHVYQNGDGVMTLDPKIKELLRLRLSRATGCHVCNSFNVPSTLAAGYSRAQVEAITAPTPELFSEREIAVLDLAGELEFRNAAGKLSPDLYTRLRRHFSDAQILELGMIAVFLSAMGKLLVSFDLVSKDEVCALSRAA